MSSRYDSEERQTSPSRNSIRLTFRVADGEVALVSKERLRMITPPSVGERPEIGTNGGYWVELRNGQDAVIFHRVLTAPLLHSVELFAPDGTIERAFGESAESRFEVLIPDRDDGRSIALIGESLTPSKSSRKKAAETRELAQFSLVDDEKESE